MQHSFNTQPGISLSRMFRFQAIGRFLAAFCLLMASSAWAAVTTTDLAGNNLTGVPYDLGQTYIYAPPSLASVTPTTGAQGATIASLAIVGTNTNFVQGTSVASFSGTGITVNSLTVTDGTHATANITISGAAATTARDVTVTTGAEVAVLTSGFTVVVPVPTVTSISPTTGPTAGGTVVTLTGTAFTGATAVKFGATSATGVVVNSPTSITATSPAGSAGTVDVTVTTPGGTSVTNAGDQFIYVAAPTVTSLGTTSGTTAGGTVVVITGTNLTGATAVKFGASSATGVVVNSPTSITATSPAGSAGIVDVTVITVGGTSATSAADQFTYVASPTITSISPTSGSTAGGTVVVITGTNLTGATAVTIGGTTATLGANTGTTLSVTTGAHAAATGLSVLVTTPAGTNAANTLYTYAVPADLPATITGGTLTLDGTGSANAADTTLSVVGLYLEIHDPNRTIGAGPGMIQDDPHTVRVLLSSITSMVINGTSQADAFTMDFNNGDFTPAGGITLNGGAPTTSPGDSLTFAGTFSDGKYDTGGVGSGDIDLGLNGLIHFTGLEPVDFSASTFATFTVIVDPSNVYAGNVTTTVATADAGVNTLVSFDATSGLESVKLGTVTGTLTINGDNVNNDYLVLQGLGSQMTGNFTVDGMGGDADVIDVNNTTFTVPGLNKNLSLKADFIGIGRLDVAPGSDQPGVINCSGNITLEANGDSSVSSSNPLWNTTIPVVATGVWGALPSYFNGTLLVSTLRGSVQVRGDILKTTGSDATLTLKATGSLVFPSVVSSTANLSGRAISTNNKLNVVLQADSDTLNSGSVALQHHAVITTNGGDLTIGGGSIPLTSPANGTGGSTIYGAGAYFQSAQLTSGGGSISIRGKGADSSSVSQATGVAFSVTSPTVDCVIDSGAGNMNIVGVSGINTTSTILGVSLSGATANAVHLKSSTGNITINGTCLSTGASTTSGVLIQTNADIKASSTGNISITGSTAATITATVADISVTTASPNPVTISSVGGNVTFIGDSMNLAGSTGTKSYGTSGSGVMTLKQRTNGKSIDLGATDTASLLGLSTTELGLITAPTLTIGDANSGTINISAALNPSTFTTLALANNTTIANTGGFTSTISSATNFTNMTVTGTVSINTSATLSFASGGGFVPSAGQNFKILDNDGSDAIVGNFTGLAEGATISNFLTSGITEGVTYAGGTGNDLLIGVAPTVTSSTSVVMLNATTVLITGTGFSTTPANNTVVFNDGTVGHVTSATATSLTVALDTPPASTGSLTAVVTTNGLTSGSAVQVATVTTYALGTTALLEGPAAGTDSVVLTVTPETSTWTATANAAWLHTSASGTGSANVVFTFDANAGATRSGTLTIAGQTLTVTQAGSTYVPANPVATLVSIGLNQPFGVAVDGSGNVYIADVNNNAIKQWTAATNTLSTLVSSGLSGPFGVAVDGSGNVYIADSGNNAIKKWTAATSTVSTLVSSGLSGPYGVAVDGSGNVYIADSTNNAIKKWTAATSTVSTLVSSGLSGPFGVAVDGSGNVYIADVNNNAIKQWTAATNTVSTLVSSGLSGPYGVAVDGSGNVYIADSGNNAIKKWTAATSTVSTLVSSGLNIPRGVTVDGSGNVYIAEYGNSTINEVPYAFVDPTAKAELFTSGTDALPVVLPSTTNLSAPFLPTSDSAWLTLGSISSGVVNFNFAANTGAARTAHISLLGQSIAINQAAVPAPTVTSISPTSGSTVGGTVVTITGTHFTAATAVSFGGTAAASYSVTNDTTISATTPAGTAGTASVLVTNGGGTNAANSLYTYVAPPTVTLVTTNLAINAGTVTITGTGFSTTPANNTVTFNRSAAGTVSSATTTSLTVTLNTSPTSVGSLTAVVTNTSTGLSSGSAVQVATVVPVITPSSANVAANAGFISISGFGFDSNKLNDGVTFSGAGTGSPTVTAASSSGLAVNLPSPLIAGVLNASMTSNGVSSGTAVQVATITPVVTSSTTSLAANATTVTINGAGFDPTAANNSVVLNDGSTGTITSATNTQLTVTFSTKPTSAGTLTAIVTTNSVSSGSAVQVATVIPVVTSSTAGILTTGTTVTINGFGFDSSNANNSVTFNLGATGSVTTSTPTQIVVTFGTKPTVGTLNAVVTSNTQSSGAAVQVATVFNLAITSSTASLAQNATQLIINGVGFSTTAANNTVVLSSGTATVTAATATQLTCTLTGSPSLGALNATLTVTGEGSTGPTQVATIVAAPTVTLVSTGIPINATTVTITGTGFDTTAANNTVTLNDGATGTVTAATATSLTVTFGTQPTAVGSLTAVVTSFGGSSGTAKQVATVNPVVTSATTSLAANATSVTIAGFGFDTTAANNSVTFNDSATGTVTAATSTSLTVTFIAKPASAGTLTAVVNTDMFSSGSAVQVATVIPVVTSSTASIQTTGTTVTINGFGFDSSNANNSVTFNLGATGSVTTSTPTQIIVTFGTKPTVGTLNAVVTSNTQSSGSAVQVATVVNLAITSSTASLAQDATQLIINGVGFSTTAANNTVVLSSGTATVTAATATQLSCTLTGSPSLGALNATLTVTGSGSTGPTQVATIVAAPVVTLTSTSNPITATTVTITGTGFDTTAANNTVTLNDGATGTVTSATATSLTVTFGTKPTAVGSLTAVVTSFGGSSGAAKQVATVAPVVTSSSSNLSVDTNTLIINGFGFDTTAANNTVAFSNGATGTVTSATSTQLTVTFVTHATSLGSMTAIVTTDTVSSGSAVQVATVIAGAATHFTVTAPGTATAGVAINTTVTAMDQFGNTATGYLGTIHFTKTDASASAVVPGNYTFVAGDSGVHTFTGGVTLATVGTQTVTATDTVTGSITGTSGNIVVSPAAATHLAVTAPGTATAGVAFTATVTALDQFGNTATGYLGTIHFTKTDASGSASVPGNYTFLAGDSGVHTFSVGVTLATVGTQTVTATDTVTGSITGTSGNVVVSAAAATHLAVTAPGTATAGVAINSTVTALDAFGNTATGYLGTVHFTKTDSGSGSAVPVNYTFLAGDSGVHTFTGGVTLVTSGTQTVTATDTVTGSINGTSGNIVVSSAAATHLAVTAPGTATAGVTFNTTVTAMDQFGNTATGYLGTVHFTKTDASASAVVPGNYTFVAGDSGVHTFTGGVTLATVGTQTVTATDTVTGSITGTSGNIVVSPAAATHLAVTAPGTATAGVAINTTVTALDQFGNTATGYLGTVHFTKTDSGSSALVPVNYTFVAGDSGVHVFTGGVTLVTVGSQTVTATDTVTGSITGTSGNVVVSPAAASQLVVSAPGTATAGVAINTTVTALDQFGNTATGYLGTVHFTKTDSGSGSAVPVNYTFLAGDSGVHTFTGGVTLVTSGTQTVTATDTVTGSITGTSGNIVVGAAAATQLIVSAPGTTTAGVLFSSTVTALDQFGNTATGYRGIVHFTKTDVGVLASVPVNYTFTAGDSGVHTFASGVKLVTAGNQTVTATDAVTGSINGTSGSIAVSAAAASHLAVSAAGTATAGVAINSSVTALDPYGNTAISYTGTVHFTASDAGGSVVLPANYTFLPGDNGMHVFSSALTFVTAGTQTLTATDTISGSITGTSTGTTVSAAAATHLVVTAPGTATAGVAIAATVTAQDQFGNTATSYLGMVNFTKTDPGSSAAVPSNYTFVVGDNGVHTFASGVTLVSAGSQTVTATDTVTGSITGTSSSILVSPAATSHFVVTAPATAGPGTPITVTLTAQDAFNNITPAYTGTVAFSLSDSAGGTAVPANYTFLGGDAGIHTFTSGVTFATPGVQTVTATDTVSSSVKGLATVNVGTVNPTPIQLVPTNPVTGLPLPPGSLYPVISQSGTLEVRVSIKNTTAFPINGFRLSVDYSAYLPFHSLVLYNRTSPSNYSEPAHIDYIDYPYPVAVNDTVSLKLQFYTTTRALPNPFSPTLTVSTLATSEVSSTDGSGVQPRIYLRPNNNILLEWDSTVGQWYRIKYSSDLVNWYDSPVPVQGVANRTQWLDDGPPFTNVPPASVGARYYKLNTISAPVGP